MFVAVLMAWLVNVDVLCHTSSTLLSAEVWWFSHCITENVLTSMYPVLFSLYCIHALYYAWHFGLFCNILGGGTTFNLFVTAGFHTLAKGLCQRISSWSVRWTWTFLQSGWIMCAWSVKCKNDLLLRMGFCFFYYYYDGSKILRSCVMLQH